MGEPITKTDETRFVSGRRIALVVAPFLLLWGISFFVALRPTPRPIYFTPTPVDEWRGMGFERRALEEQQRLEDIDKQEYERRKSFLLKQEDEIVRHFPRNQTEYDAYESRWAVIPTLTSLVGIVGAISVIILAWRHDLRIGKEMAVKLAIQKKQLG